MEEMKEWNQYAVICFVKILNLLYNYFMYSLVSLLSGIYPLPAIHSLLVTLYVVEFTLHVWLHMCVSLAVALTYMLGSDKGHVRLI